jgi:ElaB/YqjD/DUF883 family membrane-anchored ribosome-binding protein
MSGTKRTDSADRDILVRDGNGHTTPTTSSSTASTDGDEKAAAIRADIDKTRTELSGTIRQIEERLSPAHLKEQVLEQFHDAKEKVKHEVREELQGAKQMVRNEIAEAKHAVRDATIGRVEHMVDSAKSTLSDGGNTLVDTIRANPIPAILAGVGLTWLIMSGRKNSSARVPRMSRGYGESMYGSQRHGNVLYTGRNVRGYASDSYDGSDEGMLEHGRHMASQAMHRAGDAAGSAARYVRDAAGNLRDAAGNLVDQAGNVFNDAGEKIGSLAHQVGDSAAHMAHDAGDRVNHLAHDARDAMGHLAHDTQERAAHLAHQAREQAMRLEGSAENTYRENPLAVGAAAFALGTVVGLSLPHTQREDEWMGETRDRMFDKASHMAGDAVGAAKEKVQGVVDEIGAAASNNGSNPKLGTAASGKDKTSHA